MDVTFVKTWMIHAPKNELEPNLNLHFHVLHKLLRAVESDNDRKPPPSFFCNSFGELSGGPDCGQRKTTCHSPQLAPCRKKYLSHQSTHALPPAKRQDLTLSSLPNYCWLQYLMLVPIPPSISSFLLLPTESSFLPTLLISPTLPISLAPSLCATPSLPCSPFPSDTVSCNPCQKVCHLHNLN